jgi:hypothetical protein
MAGECLQLPLDGTDVALDTGVSELLFQLRER